MKCIQNPLEIAPQSQTMDGSQWADWSQLDGMSIDVEQLVDANVSPTLSKFSKTLDTRLS